MKSMRIAGMVAVMVCLAMMASSGHAQEEVKEVCFVYFTADCPNCWIADGYVDNVRSGQDRVVVIIYNVDDPTVNMDVLNAYKEKYHVDFNRPLVLFGVYDAYRGMDDIRLGLQKRVDYLFTQNGNECPLVDGTTVAATNLDAGSLPGEPEIKEIPWEGPGSDVPATEPDGEEPGNNVTESPGVVSVPELFSDFGNYVSDPENLDSVIIISVLAAIICALVAVYFIGKRKRGWTKRI
jgi:hypothetical protein